MELKMELWNGDCLELMKNIPDNSIDCIICDLPYNVTHNKWDTLIPMDALWSQYERITKNNGAIILFGQDKFTAKVMLSNEKLHRYNLIWKKGGRCSGFLNANRMPLRNHEDIMVFYKSLPTYNPQFTEGIPLHGKGSAYKTKETTNNCYGKFTMNNDERKGTTQKYPKSVLEFERPHPPIHPTQKPTELIEWLVRTYTNEGDIVLDNCMGSGTTGVACKHLSRNFIGIELDEKYFQIAKGRIENE